MRYRPRTANGTPINVASRSAGGLLPCSRALGDPAPDRTTA